MPNPAISDTSISQPGSEPQKVDAWNRL